MFLDGVHRYVVDRNASGGRSVERAIVNVTVKYRAHPKTIDRLFQSSRAEKRINLRRLAFAGLADRRVVQQRHSTICLQFDKSLLEAHSVIDCLLYKFFHKRFSPSIEHATTKTAAEPADAGETNTFDFDAFSVEHGDAGLFQYFTDKLRLARFKIVIAEDGENRYVHGRAKIDNQLFCFFSQTVVGQIAAEQKDICPLRACGEGVVQGATRMFPVMNIRNRCDPQLLLSHSEIGNGCPRPSGREARKEGTIHVVQLDEENNGKQRKSGRGVQILPSEH